MCCLELAYIVIAGAPSGRKKSGDVNAAREGGREGGKRGEAVTFTPQFWCSSEECIQMDNDKLVL